MVKISRRLQLIADRVPANSRIADIGSDHALLPTYLAQSGVISFAIAGEINIGPLKSAEKQVTDAGLASRVSVRQGNGLAVVSPEEVDVVTIAGMGGSLIATILTEGIDKLDGVQKLILQPNVGEEIVRKWLIDHRWFLTEETILEEDGKIYEILSAVRDQDAEANNRELYAERQICNVTADAAFLMKLGPYFVKEGPEVWHRKWHGEIAKLEMIDDQLSRSTLQSAMEKRKEIRTEIEQIEEVLQCLHLAKR